jgi:hypothetical protein
VQVILTLDGYSAPISAGNFVVVIISVVQLLVLCVPSAVHVDHCVQVTLTLDGYSAPISAGNFVVNVLDGIYNNK